MGSYDDPPVDSPYRRALAGIVELEAKLVESNRCWDAAETERVQAEAERDEWRRKYELERGHVLRGVTDSEWVRRDLAEETITKAEAERDALKKLVDPILLKFFEAEREGCE